MKMIEIRKPTGACFMNSCGGNVTVVTGLMLLPMMFAIGSAIDYSGAASKRTKLQSATDAALLFVARGAAADQTSTDAALQQYVKNTVQTYVRSMLGDAAVTIDEPSIAQGRSTIKVTTHAAYTTAFMQLAGVGSLPLTTSAQTVVPNSTYEIALVLDNSSSMITSAGGKSKLDALKEAAKALVAAMFSTSLSASKSAMSLVPFTGSVRVGKTYQTATWIDQTGKSSIHWQNFDFNPATGAFGSTTWKPKSRFDVFGALNVAWGGCVESRPIQTLANGAKKDWGVTDDPPDPAYPDSYFVPVFAPDEPGSLDQTAYNFGSTSYTYKNSYMADNGGSCPAASPAAGQVDTLQKRLCKYKNASGSPPVSTAWYRGPNATCTAQAVQRLTTATATITAAIDNMQLADNTNLLESVMWGWRTLSPSAPFADGRSYTAVGNQKIIVLMTDGMNFWRGVPNHNSSEYTGFGFYTNKRLDPTTAPTSEATARAQMDERTLTACANAKAKGITIYTVGFSVPIEPIDSAGLALLRTCASSIDKAYVAGDANAIVTVFKSIADSIGNPRVSQ